MKFFDAFKIAMHNIKNNKSRSILTIIIVMIVSTLIMGLTTFGIMYNNNSIAINETIFENNGTYMTIEGKREDRYNSKISREELVEINKILEKNKNIINFINVSLDQNMWEMGGFSYVDFSNYTVSSNKLIKKGHIWGKDDCNSNHIWISDSYAEEKALEGKNYNVNDVISFDVSVAVDTQVKYYTLDFVIEGIYSRDETKYKPLALADYHYILDQIDVINVSNMTMEYYPPNTDYDFDEIYSLLETMDKDLKALIGTNNIEGNEYERFSCSIVNDMKFNRLSGLIIMSVLALLALIVLLLSVGSVANTMIILVEKNRKFIGLLKALGLEQKGVKRIVSIESFVIMFIGVFISGVILFTFIQPMMLDYLTIKFKDMYSFTKVQFEVVSNIPYYVPVIVFVIFYMMAKLSSRKSLRKIASQDVISTISEVA